MTCVPGSCNFRNSVHSMEYPYSLTKHYWVHIYTHFYVLCSTYLLAFLSAIDIGHNSGENLDAVVNPSFKQTSQSMCVAAAACVGMYV